METIADQNYAVALRSSWNTRTIAFSKVRSEWRSPVVPANAGTQLPLDSGVRRNDANSTIGNYFRESLQNVIDKLSRHLIVDRFLVDGQL